MTAVMKLADYLAAQKMTRTHLAKSLGVSQQAVSFWTKGDRTPAPNMMRKIVAATGGCVTPNDFVLEPRPRRSDEAA